MTVRILMFLAFVTFLSMVNMTTASKAEIALTGERPKSEPDLNELADPRPNPLGNCLNITQDILNEDFLHRFRSYIAKELGIDLVDFATRPDLLTIEECNDILVVSTVNSVNSSGRTLRFFFPTNEVTRRDFRAGRFGTFVFLMN